MYQVVIASEFIRDLKESTGAGGPGLEVPPRDRLPEPVREVIELPRARPGLAAVAAAIFGAANRLLGAH
ncbi:MAG TPA: hypothetical protein VEB43_19930 [Anaeromyxobacter sp.]|nr:hypothetical protein [Anaeromyxobacter sp.]